MTYSEAIERFGSDKPDLRINLELKEVKEIFLSSDFKVFSGPANDLNSRVVALKFHQNLQEVKLILIQNLLESLEQKVWHILR